MDEYNPMVTPAFSPSMTDREKVDRLTQVVLNQHKQLQIIGQQGVAQLNQIQKLAKQLDEANIVRQKVNAGILQQVIKMKEDQTSTVESINKLTIRLEDDSSAGLTALKKLEKEI